MPRSINRIYIFYIALLLLIDSAKISQYGNKILFSQLTFLVSDI